MRGRKRWTDDILRLLFVLIVLALTIAVAAAEERIHPEKWYQERECIDRWGMTPDKMEFKVPNDPTPTTPGRVDCLLPNHAVEFDFAPKWPECIGQALYYAKKTGKAPACALIVEDQARELPYIVRLYDAVAATGRTDFIVFLLRP